MNVTSFKIYKVTCTDKYNVKGTVCFFCAGLWTTWSFTKNQYSLLLYYYLVHYAVSLLSVILFFTWRRNMKNDMDWFIICRKGGKKNMKIKTKNKSPLSNSVSRLKKSEHSSLNCILLCNNISQFSQYNSCRLLELWILFISFQQQVRVSVLDFERMTSLYLSLKSSTTFMPGSYDIFLRLT
jgi:hypothetical protein